MAIPRRTRNRDTSECTSQCILILLCDEREKRARARRPSLAIVMSVRCARRRDLPTVIACKHPCGGNTTKDVSSLSFTLFSRSRARRHDELIYPPTRHGGHQDGGCLLSLGRTSAAAAGIFSRFTPACTDALGGFRTGL